MNAGIIILLSFAFGLFFLMDIFFDRERIEADIHSKGGKLISKDWPSFGRRRFAERGERIYRVTYMDNEGNKKEAFVRTSAFRAVYFSDDKIIELANKNSFKEENETLKLENTKLKEQLSLRKRDDNKKGSD